MRVAGPATSALLPSTRATDWLRISLGVPPPRGTVDNSSKVDRRTIQIRQCGDALGGGEDVLRRVRRRPAGGSFAAGRLQRREDGQRAPDAEDGPCRKRE